MFAAVSSIQSSVSGLEIELTLKPRFEPLASGQSCSAPLQMLFFARCRDAYKSAIDCSKPFGCRAHSGSLSVEQEDIVSLLVEGQAYVGMRLDPT